MKSSNTPLISSTYFLDYEHSSIQEFKKTHTDDNRTKKEQAIDLYYAVRDEIRYDPYTFSMEKEQFKASAVLAAGRAWCVPKSILYAACCRSIELPARLGFADVKNHLSTERMRKTMKTNVFHWHGYASVLIENHWVKATPAFNIELCDKFNLKPLEFDGTKDSLYHAFDTAGNKHMEYIHDRGEYDNFPFEELTKSCLELYPNAKMEDASFEDDVEAEVA